MIKATLAGCLYFFAPSANECANIISGVSFTIKLRLKLVGMPITFALRLVHITHLLSRIPAWEESKFISHSLIQCKENCLYPFC